MSNDAELSKRALRFEVGEGVERYRRVVEGGAGRIIFIGGSPGSGRTLLLRTLEEELDRVVPRPVVVAGGFFRGEYEPWERSASKAVAATERAKAVISGVTALGAPFAGVVPYGPLAISAGRLATQLLSASVVLRKLLPTQEAVDRAAGTALELKALLRRAAEERPVVCLLDDLDQSHGRVWWASLIQSFALEVANGLPLLILVTVSDARVASEDEDAVGSLEALAARLEARDVAERWQLHATSIDAVRDWLDPCSSDIAELLVEATRGRPGWIAELWSEWVRTGTVQRFDAVSSWMFIEEPAAAEPARVLIDIVDERLEQLVGHDLVALDRAKRCLACAALEGREFSAPALAHVLERPLDEVIDLLDDVLVVDEARPDGLVVERGLVTIESEGKPPRHVWRYAFVSELHRSALIAYGLAPQERIDLALGYAQALTELYAPSEWLVADALARLFATGGDHRAAEGYRRLAEFTGEVELLRRQARLVLDADTTSWDRAEYAEALHLLLLAGDAMEPSPDAATEGLAVYERACEFADRLGARRDRAFARWGAASCHRSRFESERAIEMFEHAREEFAQLNDPEWETATLIDLANEHAFVGRFERARELLEEASVAARRLRDAESKGLAKLAILERRVELEDDPVEQRRCLKQVLELKRRYRRAGWSIYPTERGLASILMTELDLVGAEMDIDAPDALRDTLLRIEREAGGILGLPGMVMAALLAMARGQLATRNADFVASRSQLADALTLFRAIGNRPGEANAWRALGDLAWQQDRKTAAAIHYATSVFISRTTGSWKANHATQDLLAMRQGEHSADAVERLVDEIGTAYAADGGEALATAVRSDEWPPATKYVRAATHFLGESP